jgi:hypothetical protein
VNQKGEHSLPEGALPLLLGFEEVLEHATTSRGRGIVPGN